MTHITKELLQESLIHRVAYVLKYSPIFDKLFKQILIGLKQTIENHPEIQNQLHEIVACTGKITNNKEQAKHFLKSCSAPALVELMNELTRQLSTNNKWLTTMPTDLEFNGNLDTIRESTTSYIEKRYGIIDMRQQTDSRLIRRMDSLARIFSLNPISSVCTAVTFYEGRLIIAANLSHEDKRDKVIEFLLARCKIIHTLIAHVIDTKIDDISQHTDLIEQCSEDLRKAGGSSLPPNVFSQAIMKFVDAICIEDIGKPEFTYSDKLIFKQKHLPVELLLPAFSQEGDVAVQIIQMGKNEPHGEVVPLHSSQNSCDSINLIHAEQLIAWRVFIQNNEGQQAQSASSSAPQTNLRVGISKLCCKTCETNLKRFPIETRGSHGQNYNGVFSLFSFSEKQQMASPDAPSAAAPTAKSVFQTPPRRAKTAADPSPLDTIKKVRSRPQMDLEADIETNARFKSSFFELESPTLTPLLIEPQASALVPDESKSLDEQLPEKIGFPIADSSSQQPTQESTSSQILLPTVEIKHKQHNPLNTPTEWIRWGLGMFGLIDDKTAEKTSVQSKSHNPTN